MGYSLMTDLGKCLVSALDWALTTQISNTMLSDDDLHRVLAVVVVANHRQECRDSTTLSG